jgi:ribonuclease Z
MPKPGRPRVWFLGTASSVASGHRANAAFALRPGPDDSVWLVDAGPAVVDRLAALGLDPRAVEHVFLTHQHGDHLLGLPMLNNARWDAGRADALGVHGPRAALEALRAVTLAVYPDQRERLRRSLRRHAHPTNRSLRERLNDAATVRSAPARHSVPAVAYRFDVRGASVVFSGDTAPIVAVARLAAGADLLVHDATFGPRYPARGVLPDHSTALQAGEVAQRARVRRLALVHLPPAASGYEEDLRAEAAAAFSGEVLVPADGEVIGL